MSLPESRGKRTQTVKFVPNQDAPDNETLIANEAKRNNQNPDTVVVVPFAELEGELTTVDTHILSQGQPVSMDVFQGFSSSCVIEQEKPTQLGERIADELDSFESPDPSEIKNQLMAHIVGEDEDPPITTINSEEDIVALEKYVTGHDIDG